MKFLGKDRTAVVFMIKHKGGRDKVIGWVFTMKYDRKVLDCIWKLGFQWDMAGIV